MTLPEPPSATPAATQDDVTDNRRRRGRVKTSFLKCSLGRVVDISATGIRVRGTGFGPASGAVVTFDIFGPDEPATVQARVVWAKRRFFRFEIGMEFSGLSANARRAIAEIARSASSNMLDAHQL